MRKLFLLSAFIVLMMSCKSPAPAASNTVARKSQVAIKGNWVISSVTYPGSEYIKVTSFGMMDSQCFEGSTWKFVSNNDTGEMTISKANCPNFTSKIQWYVNKENQFVLKVLSADDKAKKVRNGYILYLDQQSSESFRLTDKLGVGGKMTSVVYQFQKINE